MHRMPPTPTLNLLRLPVYTMGQISKICSVAARTVSKWFDSGKLRGYRIPGSTDRRVPREDLIRFLHDNDMPQAGAMEEAGPRRVLLACLDADTSTRLHTFLQEIIPALSLDVLDAPDLFTLGGLCAVRRPDLVVMDLSGRRGEMLSIADRLRVCPVGACPTILVAIVPEDDPAEGLYPLFDVGFPRPFDIAVLGEYLREHLTVQDSDRGYYGSRGRLPR